jgi:hypothetical protein
MSNIAIKRNGNGSQKKLSKKTTLLKAAESFAGSSTVSSAGTSSGNAAVPVTNDRWLLEIPCYQ